MYTKLGRKNRRKLAKIDDAMFEKMSDDSLEVYNKLDKKFQADLDRSLSKLKGSIFYIQKGPFLFKYSKDPQIARWQDTFINMPEKEERDVDN